MTAPSIRLRPSAEPAAPDQDRRPWRWLVAFYALAVVVTLAMPSVFVLDSFEEWTRDLRIAIATPNVPQSESVVVVTVDEDTLDQFTYRFPVDRAYLAALIRKLDGAGARAIGIDMLFDRPTEPDKDAALKSAIAGAETVVMPIWAGEDQDTTGARAEFLKDLLGGRPTGYGIFSRDRRDHAVRAFSPVVNPDPEAEVRWHFAAALVRAIGIEVPETADPIRIDWRGLPSQKRGSEFERPFREYPGTGALYLPDAWFKDKVVLIGARLADIDRHQTPLNVANWDRDSAFRDAMPGVVVHAHIISQLIEGRSQGRVGLPGRIVLALIACGLGLGLALMRIPLWLKVAAGTAGLAAYGAGAFALFYIDGPMVPIVQPAAGFLFASILTTVYLGRRERSARALIRTAFAKYVPPTVVARLDRDPSILKLGGERRAITLMFTDLEGFTSLSENMDAVQLGEIINDYLDGLGSIVLSHGGTIDKFLGDGSMSFFGAPESAPDDATRAIACALAIQRFSEDACRRWEARNISLGRTRIGMHTGPAVVGNFGGRERFDYTALGDVVNTAARLEGANKLLGTKLLTTEGTRSAAPDAIYRKVGNLLLPGKHVPIATYEPLDRLSPEFAWLDAYEAAVAEVESNGPDALERFTDLAERHPEDGLIAFHRDRLRAGLTGLTISIETK